jgi:hypothetical protein
MLVLVYSNTFSQATYTSNADGNWSSASSWTPSGTADSDSDGIPDSNDDVIINHSITVLTSQAANTVVNNFSSGKLLTLSGNSGLLTVTSTFTNNDGVVLITGGNSSNPATLTINGNFVQEGEFTINAGQRLVMGASSTIAAKNPIVIKSSSDSYGSLYLYSTFSQESGSGKVSYRRFVAGTASWDLISVPISDLSINTFATGEDDLATNGVQYAIGEYSNTTASYNAGTGSGANTWLNYTTSTAPGAGNFTAGKGYQMATDNAGAGGGAEMTFDGIPNTGSVTIAIISSETGTASDNDASDGSRFNLVGNPYPSFLSVTSVISGNSSVLHANNQAVYGYTGSGYTTYNNASGGYIAPGQGFMVGADSASSANFEFTTSMQSTSNTSMDDFISGDPMDDDRAELFIGYVSNEDTDRTRLYFIENMTDGLDLGYDAAKISFADNFISSRLVSDDDGSDITIQSLAYSELSNKIIPLVVNSPMGQEFTLSITHNTTPADLNVYLEDVVEGTMTDLKAGDFILTPSTDLEGVGRFFIHTTADTMSNNEVSTSMLNAFKEVNSNYITLEGLATQSNNINVSLYNILGTKVLDTALSNNMNTQTISTLGMASGIYVIELESGNDRLTKKLIIQ